ncbi:MAG: methionine--tRNA ligase subunit beta, partial [Terracidiphilus sp.]
PWKKPEGRSDEEHTALQARVLATAAEAIRIVTALVYPVMPDAAARVWRQLGQGEIADAAHDASLTRIAWGGLQPGTKFGEPAPLFPRAEKDAVARMVAIEEENNQSVIEAAGGPRLPASDAAKAPSHPAAKAPADEPQNKAEKKNMKETIPTPVPQTAASAAATAAPAPVVPAEPEARTAADPHSAPQQTAQPQLLPSQAAPAEQAEADKQFITIDDFVKVDLRVAQVLVAERIPKADKLLRLEVDLGYEKRQILAGIAQYYEPEKLVGRKIVIVANLAPRKMRGLESNGMLLAASLPDGAPVLAGFLEEVPLGARLK